MSKQYATVYAIEWVESERSWGQRPDGFTYHPTRESAQQYIDKYWSTMPDEAPDCYSRPGEIYSIMVDPVFALLVQGNGFIYSEKRIVS